MNATNNTQAQVSVEVNKKKFSLKKILFIAAGVATAAGAVYAAKQYLTDKELDNIDDAINLGLEKSSNGFMNI